VFSRRGKKQIREIAIVVRYGKEPKNIQSSGVGLLSGEYRGNIRIVLLASAANSCLLYTVPASAL
jgi:hypothetical protein